MEDKNRKSCRSRRMEGKSNLKFEINLQRICMTKIARVLWGKEETKQQIRFFFENFLPSDDDYIFFQKWNQHVTNELLTSFKNSSMPSNLKTTLESVISITGLQICHWRKYVSKILELEINCAEEICWTNYGTIDRIQIFKNWIEQKQLKTSQLFNIACIFCLEEYITDLWKKIPRDVKYDEFYSETIYTTSIYNIIAYWKNLLEGKRNEKFRIGYLNANFDKKFSWSKFCSNSQSIQETMFRISVLECLELGAEYFWNKLNDEERKRSIDILMKTFYPKRDETEYARILFFLTIKLSQKRSNEYFLVQSMLLKNYSAQEFFYASVGSCFSIL